MEEKQSCSVRGESIQDRGWVFAVQRWDEVTVENAAEQRGAAGDIFIVCMSCTDYTVHDMHPIKHRFTHSLTPTSRVLLLIGVPSLINLRQGLAAQRHRQWSEERRYRSQRVIFKDSPRSLDFKLIPRFGFTERQGMHVRARILANPRAPKHRH